MSEDMFSDAAKLFLWYLPFTMFVSENKLTNKLYIYIYKPCFPGGKKKKKKKIFPWKTGFDISYVSSPELIQMK